MADKYIRNNVGTLTETTAVVTSAGVGNAGNIVALDAGGHLDISLMPSGVGADTASVQASEALAAGANVNVWSSSGAFRCRNADASTTGKEAQGFVLSAVLSGATALVYFAGRNTQVSSATPGTVYLSDTVPGGFTNTAPSGTGKIVQRIGVAVSATEINFEAGQPIALA